MTIDRHIITTNKTHKSWWQQPALAWNNLTIRAKITTLLVLGATIPLIVATQAIVGIARESVLDNLKDLLKSELLILQKSIESELRQLENCSSILAQSVTLAGIDLNDPATTTAQQAKLASFIETAKESEPNASFYLITNRKGQTIARSIQIVRDDFSKFPPLPTQTTGSTRFNSVSSKSEIDLGALEIVRAALTKSRALSGVELLKSRYLKRLGLSQQANIGVRTQATQDLSALKQPYPEGTFNIDDGKVGLVMMSVKPIVVNGEVIGTAIVGYLVNRNYELVDKLKSDTGASTATLFAQDWRVSTNVPYTDRTTRAIGTRVSQAVADRVLLQGEVFLGDANIVGTDYLTGYQPLYDHRQQLSHLKAQPIGIAYVGEPQTYVNQNLQKIAWLGYAIAGGILLVAMAILAPVHGSISRPIRRLTKFADLIAAGESGVRLAESDRHDEVGMLERNLNQMAENVDSNLQVRALEASEQRQQREALESEILKLVTEVEGAMDGDLTVRASLDSIELSPVADLFNEVITRLRDIATDVKQGTGQVSAALESNKHNIRQLSTQAIAEAAEIRSILDAVEQMTDSIQSVATNAHQTSTIANNAYIVVKEVTEAVDRTFNSILHLQIAVDKSAARMKRLGESSQQISQVVSLIEGVALTTNILAVKSSVETNHTGERDRGITVVAEQVGALAAQSSAATREIAQIIATIQSEIKDVVGVMKLGTSQVVDSARLVRETKLKLTEVLQSSRKINTLMSSISIATVAQAETAKAVTQLMQQVTVASKERSIFSIRMASSMQETSQVAKKLEEKVAQFKV